MRKKITRIIAMATCTIMLATTALFASPMSDVSSTHWAYSEIMEMQKRGLLVSSSKGEFFPSNYVTYFELSQILAKATGYEDALINPNMDQALKKAIEDNYAKQKSTIEAHQKNYQHWQKDANEEIAYLLGKGYLRQEDLGKFMSKSTSGVESKRGVRKQDVAVYLVRVLHIEETAKKEYTSTGFKDEASIDASARPHVTYLKNKGIISGSANNEFGPTEPINRAILSKLLINTLNLKQDLQNPTTPTLPPTTEVPTDKGLEGQLTKMISKGDSGYYIVLEVEPTKIYTYSIEPTATVVDKNGTPISLSALKERIDTRSGTQINVTAQVSVIGTTEYMTHVKLIDSIEDIKPPVVEKPDVDDKPTVDEDRDREDKDSAVVTQVTGSIYSILIAPVPEVTIQLSNGTRRAYKVTSTTEMYSVLARKEISVWDLRLNQQVEMDIKNKEIQTLDVMRVAPPVTLTGTITQTSATGDKVDLLVSYDAATGESNVVKSISVPMSTQIIDGTVQKGRKDLRKNMQVVVVFGENGSLEPEQIVILAK